MEGTTSAGKLKWNVWLVGPGAGCGLRLGECAVRGRGLEGARAGPRGLEDAGGPIREQQRP